MKLKKILLMSIAAGCAVSVTAKSPKRGVCENSFSMGSMLEALEPGVSWYYNWGNMPGKGYQDEIINFKGMEFVPMVWNGNYSADNIREYVKSHPGTKYLLGFNEPNFTKQANMTPQQAAELWPAVKALADELNLQLVAPALNYSPNPPYNSPTKWMDEFVALVGLDAFDFTAIHNYGGLTVMKQLATEFHDKYGKPVWVTEFCLWPNEGDPNDYVSPENQISSMVETVEWLEKTDWIFRYAWFKPIGNSNATKGPNYGLLEHPGGGTTPWVLTEQGVVYTYMAEFDENAISPMDKFFPAVDFVNSDKIGLGKTLDSDTDYPIEITRFNTGSFADYRFDIPKNGSYALTLRVGGAGEPTRFDPHFTIYKVNEDGTETALEGTNKQFSLPGDGNPYKVETFQLSLEAGVQTLRIKDAAPYQPSGIRISQVILNDKSGIDELPDNSAEVSDAIYTITGIKIGEASTLQEAKALLSDGIYIWKNRKIAR